MIFVVRANGEAVRSLREEMLLAKQHIPLSRWRQMRKCALHADKSFVVEEQLLNPLGSFALTIHVLYSSGLNLQKFTKAR